MIKLTEIAEKFENELNAQFNNPEIQFKIWSRAGDYQPFRRENNTVIWYINGNLVSSTSANDANDLVMGVNGLTLDFLVPVKRPRTNTKQTEEEIARIQDGQFKFVEDVANVINRYFQQAQVFKITDDEGKKFTIAFQAGVCNTGSVDLVAVSGECIGISVYIELYFIENGINSKEIKITIDGNTIPYQALRIGRSAMLERDVFSGSLISKSVITSTAFAIDIDLPTLNGVVYTPISIYLKNGDANVGHFVSIDYGSSTEYYFMTVNTAQTSAQGVSIGGTSVSLIEVSDGYFLVPGVRRMGRFKVPNSSVKQIRATIFLSASSDKFLAYVGGKCAQFPRDFVLDVTPQMVQYDKATNAYYVYIVFPRITTVNNPTADGNKITYSTV